MEDLEDILFKYDFPKRTSISTTIVNEIETELNFRFPEDYKYFLNHYKESFCFVGQEYLSLWDIDNLLERNKGYEIQTYLSNTIGIGSNGSGECIAIELLDNNVYRIVLTPFIFEKEYGIEIGTSFTDMFVRLDKGIEWFH